MLTGLSPPSSVLLCLVLLAHPLLEPLPRGMLRVELMLGMIA